MISRLHMLCLFNYTRKSNNTLKGPLVTGWQILSVRHADCLTLLGRQTPVHKECMRTKMYHGNFEIDDILVRIGQANVTESKELQFILQRPRRDRRWSYILLQIFARSHVLIYTVL